MKINLENFILKSDAYKQTHFLQYPENTSHISSYYESRGGKYEDVLFFGLQYILKRHFIGQVVTHEMIDQAIVFNEKLFGHNVYFNEKDWRRIVDVHAGRLPLEIKAVKEGTVLEKRQILLSIINTDPELAFLTNFVETILTELWYPITVATTSFQIKKTIKKWADVTGGTLNPFHLNDFGFRGATSFESAGIAGSAHLINFLGTDTLAGIQFGMKYYNSETIIGHSVFATEHSTTTIYGRENEHKALEKFIDSVPDDAIISLVSDSYDIYAAAKFFGHIRDKIMARRGRVVVRPDSGNPVDVSLSVIQQLWDDFGEYGTVNSKGFKTLPTQIGVIYSDSVDNGMIDKILSVLAEHQFTIDNIVFGSGGGLLQKCDRDTHKFAFKASAAKVDGIWRDIYKDPITDQEKKSKRGRLKLVKEGAGVKTVREEDAGENLLETVFLNGELVREQSISEIRELANTYL